MFFNSSLRWGKNTLSPPNIIATNTIYLVLVFLVMHGDKILDFLRVYFIIFLFICIKYILKTTNLEEFERMEYICDEIIFVIKYEK